MFDYLFAGYYSFFLKRKDETPIFAAVNLLALAFMLWIYLFLGILKYYNIFNVFAIKNFGFYSIPVYLIMLMFFYFFFKKKIKVANNTINLKRELSLADLKSKFACAFFLLFPLILFALLLKK